jgi:hypothetical protein
LTDHFARIVCGKNLTAFAAELASVLYFLLIKADDALLKKLTEFI